MENLGPNGEKTLRTNAPNFRFSPDRNYHLFAYGRQATGKARTMLGGGKAPHCRKTEGGSSEGGMAYFCNFLHTNFLILRSSLEIK